MKKVRWEITNNLQQGDALREYDKCTYVCRKDDYWVTTETPLKYTQKYCLVAFMTPQNVGTEFHYSAWPLHMTLADVFAIELDKTGIVDALRSLLSTVHTVQVRAVEDSVLGEQKTPVTIFDRSKDLEELHVKLIDLLEAHGASFNTPEFVRDGFLPHATVQASGRVSVGDALTIRSVSLVDMFPDGDWQRRRVLATFELA